MPKPGQKSITVSDKTYETAKEKANRKGVKKVAPFVSELIEEA